MKKFEEYQSLIINWANEKNLVDSNKQFLKVFEEFGELCKAILENDIEMVIDSVGDTAITIIIYANQIEKDITFVNYIDNSGIDNMPFIPNFIHKELFSTALSSLNSVAHNYETSLLECLDIAWNEIKDRKGKTINGTFIKNV